MENGYYGHTKQQYNEPLGTLDDTDAYYFEVKDNKIVNCVVGYDSFAYPDEAKEESVQLKKELIGQDFSVIKERFGEEYTHLCTEETFKKAKEFDMKWLECSSEERYEEIVNNAINNKTNEPENKGMDDVIKQRSENSEITFFAVDGKKKYHYEPFDNPNAGEYGIPVCYSFVDKDIMKASVFGKKVAISVTTQYEDYGDGGSPLCVFWNYNFVIDNKKYETSIFSGGYGDPEELHYSKRIVLEKNALITLINKQELSREDLMVLQFNLSLRKELPKKLSVFSTFDDLQDKIYRDSENLAENTEALLKIYKCAKIGAEYTSQAKKMFKNIEQVVINLTNTDNQEFNKRFTSQALNVMGGEKSALVDKLAQRKGEIKTKDEPKVPEKGLKKYRSGTSWVNRLASQSKLLFSRLRGRGRKE